MELFYIRTKGLLYYRTYDERELQHIAFTLLKAISYLNEHHIIHRNLNLNNIVFDDKVRIT